MVGTSNAGAATATQPQPPSTSTLNGGGEPSEYSVNSFKPLLSKLLLRPQEFTPSDLRLALQHLASGQISNAQTGSFLASLRINNVWREPEMVEVVVKVMKELSGNVDVGGSGNVCDWTMTGESALSVSTVLLDVLRWGHQERKPYCQSPSMLTRPLRTGPERRSTGSHRRSWGRLQSVQARQRLLSMAFHSFLWRYPHLPVRPNEYAPSLLPYQGCVFTPRTLPPHLHTSIRTSARKDQPAQARARLPDDIPPAGESDIAGKP